MSVVLGAGLLGSFLCLFFKPAGGVVFLLCRGILNLYEWSCNLSMKLPFSRIVTGKPEVSWIVLYYAVLLLVCLYWICLLYTSAAQDAVNQARVVVDGEQIYIPTKEEMQTQAAAQPGASPAEGTKPQDGKVNLNTATKEELMTLSGVGESRADSIIAYREENGRFQNTEELMQIRGIKEGLYNKIKDNITV